ncbi:MAG: clan AA aspartic protease [Planctomycetota bacterium]
MGLTNVEVELTNLAQQHPPFSASFLVDTGAIDCLAPAAALKAAGVAVEVKETLELADGASKDFDYGFARITVMGRQTVVPVVMGPDDAEPLLGVVALESLGLMVDPVNLTLRRVPAKPLK